MYSRIIIWIVVIALIIVGGFYFLKPASTVQAPATENQPITNNDVTPVTASVTSAQTYNINIANFAFSPDTLNINKGDTVVWTNSDSVPHQILGDELASLSGPIMSNAQTYSFTFNDIGTFNYHCSIHPLMKANIIVR